MIYTYLFESTTFHITIETTRPLEPGECSSNNVLNLLQTCQQIRKETKLLPFLLSTFSFSHVKHLDWVLGRLTPQQRSLISSVKIVLSFSTGMLYWAQYCERVWGMLALRWKEMVDMVCLKLTGIKRVHIHVEQGSMPPSFLEEVVWPVIVDSAESIVPGVLVTYDPIPEEVRTVVERLL
jgi:hypothetical protein